MALSVNAAGFEGECERGRAGSEGGLDSVGWREGGLKTGMVGENCERRDRRNRCGRCGKSCARMLTRCFRNSQVFHATSDNRFILSFSSVAFQSPSLPVSRDPSMRPNRPLSGAPYFKIVVHVRKEGVKENSGS